MRTFIIGEAGVNHNGSFDMAMQLVDIAVEAGVDAIKFQTFKAENLVTKSAPKAEYQLKSTTQEETQFDMLKGLELSIDELKKLKYYCEKRAIQFISTPFDLESLELLTKDLDIPVIKISSGDINNAPLLLAAARSQKPVIISSGMSSLGEIEEALGILAFGYLNPTLNPTRQAFQDIYNSPYGQKVLGEKVSILHCTTEYPAPFAEVNLLTINMMQQAFELPIGYSDHTQGIAVPIAAVARGAKIIEKHFTSDSNLPGPDHKASLEPAALKLMVQSIRQVESALGKSMKIPSPSELKNKAIVRKSLVASRNIKKGEAFTEENVTLKRPGTGLSPILYWECLVRLAERDIKEGEQI